MMKRRFDTVKPILEIHDNGYLPDKHERLKFLIVQKHKIPYIKFIQKDVVESIARDVLNCSKVLMHEYQPFLEPNNEANGESDNIGNNYEIDTKLLMLNELCYEISKDDTAYIKNNQIWEIFYDIYSTYSTLRGIDQINHSSPYEEKQIKIIREIEKKLTKFNNKKNLLFIYPIPQGDFLFTVQNKTYQNKTYDFRNSYMSIFVEVLSLLKKDCNFNNDIYFAYCLYDGTYNLIKVENDGYISEAFIAVNKQKDFLEPLYVGFKDSKGTHVLTVIRPTYTNNLITKCQYKKEVY